ncbi:MAG TPA: glycerol-3-phosphate acyltransferase, partial [bacterium]|nr:glycerol-3-phosphate acyltransferase [bacterium]
MRLGRLSRAALAGYAVGTLPSADLVSRLAASGKNPRASGTRNPGGANALVVLGKRWGYAVMGLDIAKGAAACAVGRRLAGDPGAHVSGTGAVIGHCFPAWNGFRGGKGVAVSLGQCLATFPAYVPIDLAVAGAAVAGRWRHRTRAATTVASLAWVVSALVWWKKGWPNIWAPP